MPPNPSTSDAEKDKAIPGSFLKLLKTTAEKNSELCNRFTKDLKIDFYNDTIKLGRYFSNFKLQVDSINQTILCMNSTVTVFLYQILWFVPMKTELCRSLLRYRSLRSFSDLVFHSSSRTMESRSCKRALWSGVSGTVVFRIPRPVLSEWGVLLQWTNFMKKQHSNQVEEITRR